MSATGIDFSGLMDILIILLAMYLVSLAFGIIQSWLMADVSQKVIYKLRRDMSEKLDRLPLKYFDSQTYGEILSRVTNDVDTISNSLQQSLNQVVTLFRDGTIQRLSL